MEVKDNKRTIDGVEYQFDSSLQSWNAVGFERGIDTIIIPNEIDEYPVTAIERKAFLGCKSLINATIMAENIIVKEWAFAHCDNLTHVSFEGINAGFEGANVKFEKGAFAKDNKLIFLNLYKDDVTAHLMAAVPVIMEAEYLLDIDGCQMNEWLGKWDMKLKDILAGRDEDGYHLYVLCGEEDLHFDYDEYIEYKREKKAGLCMLRLIYNCNLDDDCENMLIAYLKNCTCIGENESGFNYLIKNHPDDLSFYELLVDIGCINQDNVEGVLALLADRHAQMKAYLIKRLTNAGASDFYDELLI